MISPESLRQEFLRELEHWRSAVDRLGDLDAVASSQAWQALEHYVGVALRQSLSTVLARLRRKVREFDADLRAPFPGAGAARFQAQLVALRQAYLRAEATVDFYADALATRSIPRMATLLRACDHIATRSMAEILAPLGREVPAALTYAERGLGASVIKFKSLLWDGTAENCVAAIKVTRHHALRCSALLHESGHQVAHSLAWLPELAAALAGSLRSRALGSVWSGWASEVAADAFAHVHAGYAATAALHDVIDGADDTVFLHLPGDNHPISYVRLLWSIQCNRRAFGSGTATWDRLAEVWVAKHRLDRISGDRRALLEDSVRALPDIVEIVLYTPYRALGGQPLTRLIDPQRVSPAALARLEHDAGGAAFTSPYWAFNEAIRLLALTGYRAGLGAKELREGIAQQEAWMMRLGALKTAA